MTFTPSQILVKRTDEIIYAIRLELEKDIYLFLFECVIIGILGHTVQAVG